MTTLEAVGEMIFKYGIHERHSASLLHRRVDLKLGSCLVATWRNDNTKLHVDVEPFDAKFYLSSWHSSHLDHKILLQYSRDTVGPPPGISLGVLNAFLEGIRLINGLGLSAAPPRLGFCGIEEVFDYGRHAVVTMKGLSGRLDATGCGDLINADWICERIGQRIKARGWKQCRTGSGGHHED